MLAVYACALASGVEAEPIASHPVAITSQPDGARVWIDDRSAEPVGKTPYTGLLSPGKHMVFVELDGHVFVAAELLVRARQELQTFSYQLEVLEVGYINVLPGSPSADGAAVRIDGEAVGAVPDTFAVPAGARTVEVVRDGFERFESQVEVRRGEQLDVSVQLAPLEVTRALPSTATTTQVAAPARPSRRSRPAAAHPPQRAVVGVGAGVGRRQFQYATARTGNLRAYLAPLIWLVDMDAQLWLRALGASGWLERISLIGRVSLGLPVPASTVSGDERIKTIWFRREVGVRGDVGLGPGSVRIELAEGGNSYSFISAGDLSDEVPAVAYEYLRLGVGYALELGSNTLSLGGDGLLAFSAGDLAKRFESARVVGLRGHGLYKRRLSSRADATLAGSYTRFWYSFGAISAMPVYDADGAVDTMMDMVLTVAYRF